MMGGRPWLFDNHLLVLEELNGFSQLEAHSFATESFWVQMFNLSVMYKNRKYGLLLRATLGLAKDVEVKDDDTR